MKKELTVQDIEDLLSEQIDYSDREAAERKMNSCLNLIGLSARLVSKAKGNLERAKGLTLNQYPNLNSRLIRIKMDSMTVNEQEDLELNERLWTGLHKTIDGLKSLLVIKEKETSWN